MLQLAGWGASALQVGDQRDPAAAAALFDLGSTAFLIFPLPAAALVIATTLAARCGPLLPVWLARAGLPVAAVMVLGAFPLGQFMFALFGLWLIARVRRQAARRRRWRVSGGRAGVVRAAGGPASSPTSGRRACSGRVLASRATERDMRRISRIVRREISRMKEFVVRPLLPQPGSTIDPRDAVGRGAVTKRARELMLGDNNLAISDPRRMGKTVWLDLFCARPGHGFEAVKIDFEGVQTAEQFLIRAVTSLRLHSSLPRQVVTKLKALFDNVEVTGGPVAIKTGVSTRTPTDLLDETIRSVDAHLSDSVLLVIAMDEVPIAIANIARSEGPAAAHQLLQTLRGLRRTGSRLRWIVCGSVGFHHVLRQCHATEGVINDLVSLPLGPLETAEARELAQRLLLGIQRTGSEDAVTSFVEHSGAIPFLLHALAHRLHESGAGPVTADDVALAFRQFMDDRDDSRAVTHLLARVDLLYAHTATLAEAILDRVAMEVATSTVDLAADNRVLDALIDDHYLLEHDRIVSWRYDVLRRIWIHRRRLT